MSQPAVILLAFANDESQALNELAKELDTLRSTLRTGLKKYVDAQGRRQFDIVTLAYCSVESLFDELRVYRNRIAILHFAGHTNSALWQLNDEVLQASSVANILQLQSSLKFLFLNGCDNAKQVDAFAKAGVPAIIATSAPIDDQKARHFSSYFYKHLINNDLSTSLSDAFRLAKAEVGKTAQQSQHRTLHYKKPSKQMLDKEEDWAWTLQENDSYASQWSLGYLFKDDCFGLPNLPANLALPTRPFKDIYYFSKKDAPIFFGRCKEIVKAYNALTETYYATDPIHLLYGNSGVGKSSFLDAGLIPRLEVDNYQTKYYRYDSKVRIKDVFLNILEGTDFSAAWLEKEAAENKPLIIFLDQLESLFTHHFLEKRAQKNSISSKEELIDLLTIIKDIFYNDKNKRPNGKIVLSFRKEWLAEVLSSFEKEDIPYSKIILEPLDAVGVVEAIEGITKNINTQQRYKLVIKNPISGSLAEIIAGDLLKYKQGIAPTLQILLSKMWREVEIEEQPTFTLELYNHLGKKGQLIEKHLQDQIDEIANIKDWGHDAKKNGLILDILYAHTTSLGTAGELTLYSLEKRYSHIEYRQELINQLKKRFLIIEIQHNNNYKDNVTRLTHDTLAPLIRDSFERSTLVGQRAWRVLHNRDMGKNYKIGTYDLKIIEEGKYATRKWTKYETILIKKSQNRRIIRLGAFTLLSIVFIFLGIFSIVQWDKSVKSEQEAMLAKSHLESLIKTVVLDIQHDLDTSDTQLAIDIHDKIDNYIKTYKDFSSLASVNANLKGNVLYSNLEYNKSLMEFNNSLHLVKKRSKENPSDLKIKEELVSVYQSLARHYKNMLYRNISNTGKIKYLRTFIEMNEQAKQHILELMQISVNVNDRLRWFYTLNMIKIGIVDGYQYISRVSGDDFVPIPEDYNYDKILNDIEEKHDAFRLSDNYQRYLSLKSRANYSIANELFDKENYQESADLYIKIAAFLEEAILIKTKNISYKRRQIQALYKVALSYEAIHNYKKSLAYINTTIGHLQGLKRHGLFPKNTQHWLKIDIALKQKYEEKLRQYRLDNIERVE
jgi:hypothetical protein